MYVYPIYLTSTLEEDNSGGTQKEGPTVGDVLAIRLTWHGMVRKFKKMDWRKEIIDHLIWIGERDMYEAVEIEIEEVENTLSHKGVIPTIEAHVSYAIRNRETGKIELRLKRYMLITPILDAKI